VLITIAYLPIHDGILGSWTLPQTTNYTNGISHAKGSMLFQFKSIAIRNIPNAHFIYGVMKAYGVPVKKSKRKVEDILYPLQGLYLKNTGELSLVTTPSQSHNLFLAVPLRSNFSGHSQKQLHLQTAAARLEKKAGALDSHNGNVDSLFPGMVTLSMSSFSTKSPFILHSMFRKVTFWAAHIGVLVIQNDYYAWLEKNIARISGPCSICQRESVRKWVQGMITWAWDITSDHPDEELQSLFSDYDKWVQYSNIANDISSGTGSVFAVVSHDTKGTFQLLAPDVSASPELSAIKETVDSNTFNPERKLQKNIHLPLNTKNGTTFNASHTSGHSTRSRIIPGDLFTSAVRETSFLERYPVGHSGLELLLLYTASTKKSAGITGGFGYTSLPPSFRAFQQMHGASKTWTESSKCTFGITASAWSPPSGHTKSDNGRHDSSKVENSKNSDISTVLQPGIPVGYDSKTKSRQAGIKELLVQVNGQSYMSRNVREECRTENLVFDITASHYQIRVDVIEQKLIHYDVIFTLCCAIQIGLLVLQMKASSTQASATKVSILSISAQAVLDAGICISHLLASSAVAGVAFYHFIWLCLLKLLIFCILEMRLVISVYQARYAQDMAQTGWQGLRNHLATLHARFYAGLFAAILLVDFCYQRPVIIVFALYSFWLPQIAYSAYMGSRKPLQSRFIIGMSVSRLWLPLYLFGCERNLYMLLSEKSTTSFVGCIVLVLWVGLQVVVLLLQSKWGPRFFIPSRFLPVKYNYYRPISRRPALTGERSEGDVESGEYECVICYTPVSHSAREHMVTPCDHVFHQECLSRWLEVKLECPVCRSILPADD